MALDRGRAEHAQLNYTFQDSVSTKEKVAALLDLGWEHYDDDHENVRSKDMNQIRYTHAAEKAQTEKPSETKFGTFVTIDGSPVKTHIQQVLEEESGRKARYDRGEETWEDKEKDTVHKLDNIH